MWPYSYLLRNGKKKWFNKESNWFLGVHHYNEISFCFMLWADSDYFGEGKIRKCGISNAEAERQVARLECLKPTLFCSHLYWHLPPKVKGQNNQKSHFNSNVQNCQLTDNIKTSHAMLSVVTFFRVSPVTQDFTFFCLYVFILIKHVKVNKQT